jgi:hypothetical protein
VKKSIRKNSLLIAAATLTAASIASTAPARADGPMISVAGITQPATTVASDGGGSSLCGPFDPECARRLARILSGIHVLPLKVEGGVRFGENQAQGAVSFSANVVSMDASAGDARVLMFEATYLPEAGGLRVRFTLADTDVLFFCKDDDGVTHPPLAGLFANCRPDGAYGIGGTVGQLQWDSATHRLAARWAEVNAVLNLLQNGNGLDYLKRRLNAFAGASLDTVWYNHTPNTDGNAHTALRGNVGIMGMLRSDNNHWEIRGLAGYRPNVTDWSDYSIEARTEIMYHVLFSANTMADIGLDGQFQYNSVPANSMGQFVSDRERVSAYLGAMFGITFQ